MADRVASDHSSVATARASVERDAADRPVLVLPDDAPFEPPREEVVRLVLDGDTRHARFERPLSSEGIRLRGIYDSPSMARSREGSNRLREWLDETEIPGETVLLDEVEPGFQYGLRPPGERVVYTAREAPDDSLASIAEDIDG